MLHRQKSNLRLHQLSWVLYLVGSLLVFGSWVSLVPTWLGWIGWLAAMAGWAIGLAGKREQPLPQPQPSSRVDELDKLNLLRKEGIVSEEEFQREKERILRQP